MKDTRNRRAAVATLTAVVLLALAVPAAASGDCEATLLLRPRPRPGDLLELKPARGVPKRLVEKAVALWERCPDYGLDFPAFVTPKQLPAAVTPARSLTVEYHPRSYSATCGRFRGNELHVYGFAVDAEDRVRHCGSPVLVLAHELGHVLGLADASKDPACREQVMAYVDEFNRYDRRVYDSECQAAGRRWLTSAELPAAESTAAGSTE